jgi:hypothetical protein
MHGLTNLKENLGLSLGKPAEAINYLLLALRIHENAGSFTKTPIVDMFVVNACTW